MSTSYTDGDTASADRVVGELAARSTRWKSRRHLWDNRPAWLRSALWVAALALTTRGHTYYELSQSSGVKAGRVPVRKRHDSEKMLVITLKAT